MKKFDGDFMNEDQVIKLLDEAMALIRYFQERAMDRTNEDRQMHDVYIDWLKDVEKLMTN